MKPVEVIATRTHFCVPLTEDQWDALDERDAISRERIHCDYCGKTSKELDALTKAGCENIDWNGHFGRNLFFSAETEHINSAKKAVVKFFDKITKRYIAKLMVDKEII